MQPLLLLHGAIGAAGQLQPLADALGKYYKVHAIDFSGHGERPFPDGDFSIKRFADDVLAFMEKEGLTAAHIFGYSMGGYVAMYLARHYASRVNKVVTLATKFHWDEATAAREVQMLDAEKIVGKVPAFAKALEERHVAKDWKEVLNKTAMMLKALGADNTLKQEDYKGITAECLLLLGDRDKMVGLDETLAVYKMLPAGQFGVLPGTPHPIEQVDTGLLTNMARHFLK